MVRKALARGKRTGTLSPRLNTAAAARLFVGGGPTIALARFAGASEPWFSSLAAPVTDHRQPTQLQTRTTSAPTSTTL